MDGLILGVDYGEVRTGVALCDPTRTIARRLETVKSKERRSTAKRVAFLAEKNNVCIIVVGLPKNMNNTEGERSRLSRDFADILREFSGSEVVMWDERLSTVSAINILNQGAVRGSKRKAVIDSLAAEIMLQNYLDYVNNK